MSNFNKNKSKLASIKDWEHNEQINLSMLQIQILQLKLKAEKQKDRMIYQSIKDQISAR